MSKTNLTHQQAEYLEILKKSSESLLNIINDILDISKIEAGKMALAPIPFKLRELVASLVEVTSATLQDRGLSLAAKVEDAVPEIVVGDAEKLKQVLLNLLSNAVKFTHRGSVFLDIRREAGAIAAIRFSVRDTGIGIPREKLEDVFSPFIQADDSISRQYGGTGLGLAICAELIKLMNGEMAIQSEEGTGTEISFVIPLQAAGPEVLVQEQAAALQASVLVKRPRSRREIAGLHILVVEDNEINQMLTCKTLESLGCTYRLAANGEEALTWFERERFDLILMDIQMPGMSGLVATERIRGLERDTGMHTPIAALTAHAMVGDRETCLAAGMDFYISKPLYSERLIGLLNSVFEFEPLKQGFEGAAESDQLKLQLDLEAVYQKMNGDLAFFKTFATKFKVNVEKMLTDLSEAIVAGDSQRLKSVAHALKGTLMIFEAPELISQLKALEAAGDLMALESFSGLMSQLVGEMVCFLQAKVSNELDKKGRLI